MKGEKRRGEKKEEKRKRNLRYLLESNIASLLAEATSADVEVVLPDETVSVTTNAAKRGR